MTMVVPCRLITRQRSHMGLTDGRTFISTVPVGDPTAVEVVRAQLHLDLVPGEDADVVLAHLPRDGRENVVPRIEVHPEHRARERLGDLAFHLDLLFLLGHRLSCLRTKRRRDGPPHRNYGTKPAFSRDFAAVRILGGPSSATATVCSK